MESKELLDLVLAQLAIEDPIRFGAPLDAASDEPVPVLMRLAREVVEGTVGAVGEDASWEERLRDVWMRFSREKEILDHVAAALWRAIIYASKNPEHSSAVPYPTQEDVETLMNEYLKGLEFLHTLVEPVLPNAVFLPVTVNIQEELKYLPPVFKFLADRRSKLRRIVHSQYSQPVTCLDSDADRADEALAMYHTLVMGVELPEAPENWSLRGMPDCLRETMVDLLCDLKCLADAEGVEWSKIMRKADDAYKSELGNQ